MGPAVTSTVRCGPRCAQHCALRAVLWLALCAVGRAVPRCTVLYAVLCCALLHVMAQWFHHTAVNCCMQYVLREQRVLHVYLAWSYYHAATMFASPTLSSAASSQASASLFTAYNSQSGSAPLSCTVAAQCLRCHCICKRVLCLIPWAHVDSRERETPGACLWLPQILQLVLRMPASYMQPEGIKQVSCILP
jgi:hypothetical protein